LPYSEGPAAITRNYLEKLVQIPFRLPPMSGDEARAYVSLLFIEAALRPNREAFEELLRRLIGAREHAWEPLRVDAAVIEKNLPDGVAFDERLREQLLIAGRVARTLASGSKGNPRQIKRFLNTLVLRTRLAQAYGMHDVQESVLAKLMLLERFNPTLYRALVEFVGPRPDGKVPGVDRVGGEDDEKKADALPDVLQKSTAFFEWANIEPPLQDVDLRPYLFISREYSPGYIGESAYPDLPAKLVSRVLDTSQYDETALERELSGLSGERSERLLDIALTQLRGRTDITELDGLIRGIGALSRAQPHLQPVVLEAINEYPAQKVGPFMPFFMRAAITDVSLVTTALVLLEDRWMADGKRELQEAVVMARRPRKR
jgi:predicted KAP-like P-loop ATPase